MAQISHQEWNKYVPIPVDTRDIKTYATRSYKLYGAPGTGKTTSLLNIIVGLLKKGFNLSDIQIVSFTNATTIEFTRRLETLMKQYNILDEIRCSTCHSLATQCTGVIDDLNILNVGSAGYRDAVVKYLYKTNRYLTYEDENGDPIRYDQKSLASRFDKPKYDYIIRGKTFLDGCPLMMMQWLGEYLDYCVNVCGHPSTGEFVKFCKEKEVDERDLPKAAETCTRLAKKWHKNHMNENLRRFCFLLKKAGVGTFSSSLLRMAHAKKFRRAVLENKPKVIIIDECQDLSKLQWKAFSTYCRFMRPDKIYMAGDDDQAIYIWSGVDPSDFLNAGCHVEKVLETSFRNPQNILQYAREFAERNIPNRKPKIIKPYQTDMLGVVDIFETHHTPVPIKDLEKRLLALPDLEKNKGRPIYVVHRSNKGKEVFQDTMLSFHHKIEYVAKLKNWVSTVKGDSGVTPQGKYYWCFPAMFAKKTDIEMAKLRENKYNTTGKVNLLLLIQTELYLLTWLKDQTYEFRSSDWDGSLSSPKAQEAYKKLHGRSKCGSGPYAYFTEDYTFHPLTQRLYSNGTRVFHPIVVGTSFDFKGKEAPYVLLGYTIEKDNLQYKTNGLDMDTKDASETRIGYVAITRASFYVGIPTLTKADAESKRSKLPESDASLADLLD